MIIIKNILIYKYKMKRKSSKNDNLLNKFIKLTSNDDNQNDIHFFKNNLNEIKKKNVIDELEKINKNIYNIKPRLFELIDKELPIEYKAIIVKKINDIKNDESCSSEKSKLDRWLYSFFKIPFYNYSSFPVSFDNNEKNEKCKKYLNDCEKILNDCTYGMNNVKEKFLQLIGKWIVNPNSMGTIIALKGPMGVGKTTIIKNGISKILNRPFSFVALGGANDNSYLDGHSYTYEGSSYGKIIDILIQSKVMNPIIFFDELDKVSQSEKGNEIIGVLTHLTDITQNSNFQDKYFSEFSFDLSKCLFIFSYNDEMLVNPILRDRMYVIDVKGYNKQEKVKISKLYILPDILNEYFFIKDDIIFDDEVLEYIIDKTSSEEGVRNLKRSLDTIISKINLNRIQNNLTINNYKIDKKIVDDLLDVKKELFNNNMMYL